MHNGELRILTNAHVVSDAAYVEVRKAGDARKYVATRQKISHECDLAILTVENADFWRDTTPLDFGDVPCLQDEVSVVGYPEGGEGVSVTVGVVSRIEIQRYAHSGASLLAIQVRFGAHDLALASTDASTDVSTDTCQKSACTSSP